MLSVHVCASVPVVCAGMRMCTFALVLLPLCCSLLILFLDCLVNCNSVVRSSKDGADVWRCLLRRQPPHVLGLPLPDYCLLLAAHWFLTEGFT